MNLAKYYLETERSKLVWSQVFLKIGKAVKQSHQTQKEYIVNAENAATGAKVKLLVDQSPIQSQDVPKIAKLLSKQGMQVNSQNLKLYFLIHSSPQAVPKNTLV